MTAGQEEHRFDISGISSANPAVVTTSAIHDYSTNDVVRINDLNGMMPTHRGSDQINGNKYQIVVVDTTHFKLKDYITHEYIDSTSFTPYVSNGNVNLVEKTFFYN